MKKAKAKAKSVKKSASVKKGDKYECDACGMVVAVDNACGCEPCGISCCGQEMSPVGCC